MMIYPFNLLDRLQIALLFGIIATFSFTIQYLPQAYKNYSRSSVVGFSASGILMKLVGAGFLFFNSWYTGEAIPVIFYGIFSLLQHLFFVCQFLYYTKNKLYMLWLPFPLIPFLLAKYYPFTMAFTSTIKPISQVISHFPQMWVCYQLKSTSGVSLLTHYLNIIGGLCGLIMLYIEPPKSYATYAMYANSLFQAISIFAMAYIYKDPAFMSVITFWSPSSIANNFHHSKEKVAIMLTSMTATVASSSSISPKSTLLVSEPTNGGDKNDKSIV